MSLSVESIEKAATRIAPHTRRTPIFRSELFEKRVGSKFPIYFKAENLQYTGSFKVRGALNKFQTLLENNPAHIKKVGVIAASAGNHAQGVAFHAQRLGIHAKIVMPVTSPLVKINSTKQWGAEIVLSGESYQEAYNEALNIQKREGREYIHAFDDEAVIAGQGTVAKEIMEDFPDVQNLISPIGGGGLIAGCATYLKAKNPKAKVFGVQAEGCSTFLPSLKAGKLVTIASSNTIAEGMSAKRMGDITFEICRKLIDQSFLVSDEEIAEGILWILENERLFVEGCGGAVVACAIKNSKEILSGPTAVLLSGGNLDVNFLARIIERGLVKTGRLARLTATIPDLPGSLHRFIQVFAEMGGSIVQIEHERVFGHTGLREVVVNLILETQGLDHLERIQKALSERGWRVEFDA